MARNIFRPRKMICIGCGTLVFLGHCGVKEHLGRKLTVINVISECNGYVYIHEENGGMECPNS